MEISALVIGKSVLYDQPTHVGHESVDCRPLVDRSSADCWPLVGRLLVKCRPTVDRLTADMCRLVIKYTFTLFIIMNSSSHNQSKINLRSGPPPPPLQRKKKWQKREEGVCLASPSNFSEGKARSVCELTSVLGPLGGGGRRALREGRQGRRGLLSLILGWTASNLIFARLPSVILRDMCQMSFLRFTMDLFPENKCDFSDFRVGTRGHDDFLLLRTCYTSSSFTGYGPNHLCSRCQIHGC